MSNVKQYKIRLLSGAIKTFKKQELAEAYIETYYNRHGDLVCDLELNFSPEYEDTPMSDAEFAKGCYSVSSDHFETIDTDQVGHYDEDGELRDDDGGKMNTVSD